MSLPTHTLLLLLRSGCALGLAALLFNLVSFADGRFGDDVIIHDSGDQFYPRLAARSNGEIYAAFIAGSEGAVEVFRSTDAGESWNRFRRFNWDSLGGSINAMDFHIAEGDSHCAFVAFSVTYGGADIERVLVYRVNLLTGSEGLVFVHDVSAPAFIPSVHLVSDHEKHANWRIRVVWMLKGSSGADSILYATSHSAGVFWTTPTLSYTQPTGGMNNLAVVYGSDRWMMAWDRYDQVFVRDLLVTGSPRLISPGFYPHYRPTIAIADTLNPLGGVTVVASFVRRWGSDLGCIYVFSRDGGVNWSSVNNPLGIDEIHRDEFSPHVSFSRRAGKFFFTYASRDVASGPQRGYRIRTVEVDHRTPSTQVIRSMQVNDDTTAGSAAANPYILDNPILPGQPMVVWRHWGGVGEGRIYFDAANRVTGVDEDRPLLPTDFFLRQNYPNPFNSSTTIEFVLGSSADVSLRIFDLLGREVAVLADGFRQAGAHRVTWDAAGFASGVYYYQLVLNDMTPQLLHPTVSTRKFVLMK